MVVLDMKLRAILQQEGLLSRTSSLRGDLFVEKNGRRKLWKKSISDQQAAALIEDWEEGFEEGVAMPPMSEGADAVLVTPTGEYFYADGWERM